MCDFCSKNLKCIYYGLPYRLCHECGTFSGPIAPMIGKLPFDGKLFVYDGCYLKGLFLWINEKIADMLSLSGAPR